MSPKTYSNGAENLDADFLMMPGTMQRGVTRGDTPASIPAITFRRE